MVFMKKGDDHSPPLNKVMDIFFKSKDYENTL